MISSKDLEFLQKLANLLSEYDAEIDVDCDEGSDLNGINLVINSFDNEVYSNGYCSLDNLDLNRYIEYHSHKENK